MTRTARWYRHASGAQRAGAWADRERDYAALHAVLADHAGGAADGRPGQPPVQLTGLLSLVARRAHYAGAEPVYRRYRSKQQGAQIPRWAGPEPAMRPSAAFLAEARISAFWPYREGVLEVSDAFDMTRVEWASAYLRGLAAWAADNRALAAYAPGGPPPCVPEDMAVIASARAPRAEAPADAQRLAGCLSDLAGEVVRSVLRDASLTPAGAFGAVRDEVDLLLGPTAQSLANQVLRAATELLERIGHGGTVAPDQARRLQGLLACLSAQLGKQAGTRQEAGAEGFLRQA